MVVTSEYKQLTKFSLMSCRNRHQRGSGGGDLGVQATLAAVPEGLPQDHQRDESEHPTVCRRQRLKESMP